MEFILVPAGAFIGYIVNMVGGGGGSLLLVPVLSFALGARAVAPVLAIGEELSRPARLVIFWRDINWSVARFHIPGACSAPFWARMYLPTSSLNGYRLWLGCI